MVNDIYILIDQVKRSDVALFRTEYLKEFFSLRDYFEYPSWFGDNEEPIFETDDVDEMLEFMLTGGKGYFRFYFKAPKSSEEKEIYMGMIFFNEDHSLELGIKTRSSLNEFFIEKLSKDFNSKLIMICEETFPPSNKYEFVEMLKNMS